MDDIEELLDCPFCGDKAVIGEGGDHAYVTCRHCACSTPACSTLEQAIDMWNTRVKTKPNDAIDELPPTPYENLKLAVPGLVCLACAMCKSKACERGLSKCSGIVDAIEAIEETPRNCDVARSMTDAIEKFMKEDFTKDYPKMVVNWNWNHLNRFIIWLFEKEKKKNNDRT